MTTYDDYVRQKEEISMKDIAKQKHTNKLNEQHENNKYLKTGKSIINTNISELRIEPSDIDLQHQQQKQQNNNSNLSIDKVSQIDEDDDDDDLDDYNIKFKRTDSLRNNSTVYLTNENGNLNRDSLRTSKNSRHSLNVKNDNQL